jgi:hypothetical protein
MKVNDIVKSTSGLVEAAGADAPIKPESQSILSKIVADFPQSFDPESLAL